MRPPYLSKSRFKLGLECITKLYYTSKKDQYKDQSFDDPFLTALAEGGFQVGELAKFMFCDDPVNENITINTLKYDEALQETKIRLDKEEVVIAEAAFKHENLFVRTDIVVKRGNQINIYEVKSKSFNSEDDEGEPPFLSYEGKANERINTKWIPYLYDLAFQKYVVHKDLHDKGFEIKANLILVDKASKIDIEGLNQKFRIVRDGVFKKVKIEAGLTSASVGTPVLKVINADDIVEKILNKYPVPTDFQEIIGFEEFVQSCSEIYTNNEQRFTPIGKKCKNCQFKLTPGDTKDNLKSGFNECWLKQTNLTKQDLNQPLVLELWGGGSGSKSYAEECIRQNIFYLKNIPEELLLPKTTSKKKNEVPGLSKHERRMLQVNKVKGEDITSFFDNNGFAKEVEKWQWPLHLIDFETSMVALPFHKNTSPYQGIAFQFSHHTIQKDGTVEHKDQFIHFEQGVYPNLEFIRALQKALQTDSGTIFRYHNHENTYLRFIRNQLIEGYMQIPEVERDSYIEFIDSITRWKVKGTDYEHGNRAMIDLYELVLKYYYSPKAKGSNSIKQILPAVINDSQYLRNKYSSSGIYGKNLSIKSLNFEDQIWITEQTGYDPYKTLPRVFENFDREELDEMLSGFEEVADGGAAMIAYNYLQFTDIPQEQRKNIADSLLRYCELDTLAMVMIIESWINWENT